MISQRLQLTFNTLETVIFPVWQKANLKERERITKSLAKKECEMIIEEINKNVN